MQSFTYTITDPLGIHARPAGLLVKEAQKYTSAITVEVEGKSSDAKKLFGLMGLGAKTGQLLTVTANGADEEQAVQGIKAFLEANL